MNKNVEKIIMYCTDWCPGCIQLEGFFKLHNLVFESIDVEKDNIAMEKLRELNNGDEIVPTVVIKFKDGAEKSLSEPSWGDVGKVILE